MFVRTFRKTRSVSSGINKISNKSNISVCAQKTILKIVKVDIERLYFVHASEGKKSQFFGSNKSRHTRKKKDMSFGKAGKDQMLKSKKWKTQTRLALVSF